MIDFNYFSFCLFLGGLVALASGSIVFFAHDNRNSRIRLPWMLLNLSTAIWSFGYYLMITSSSYSYALIYDWVLHVGAILIPIFYLWFVLSLTKAYHFHRLALDVATVSGIFFFVESPTRSFVSDVYPKYIFNFAPNAGPLYSAFTVYFFAVTLYAGLVLLYNAIVSEHSEALRLRYVFGSSLFGFLGGGSVFFLTFNVLIPPYPLILFTFYPLIITYAILRHQLFSVKVVATELLTFALWILLIFRAVLSTDPTDQMFDFALLISTVILGVFLIRSVIQQIEAREQIEKQEKELEVANRQQETLLHFISHEIKGYLTRGEAAFAGITQGDYGTVSAPLKQMASTELDDMRKGVDTVMNILSASDLKKGTVEFRKAQFDFRAIATKVIEDQRPAAYEKHLGLDVKIADGKYSMEGDGEKIREHVIRNLIDNAIKYTPAGTVHVELSDGDGKIHFSVQDSGVGITQEDMAHLFTEGGHGKDSIKVNVHSTGYGLFIAKEIVEAHHGRIWAESAGQGKGARFIVELPAT